MADPKSTWHNYKGQARYNMAFGDGHTELVTWPAEFVTWVKSPVPNMNYLWW